SRAFPESNQTRPGQMPCGIDEVGDAHRLVPPLPGLVPLLAAVAAAPHRGGGEQSTCFRPGEGDSVVLRILGDGERAVTVQDGGHNRVGRGRTDEVQVDVDTVTGTVLVEAVAGVYDDEVLAEGNDPGRGLPLVQRWRREW